MVINATTLLNQTYSTTEEEFLEAMQETQEAHNKEFSKHHGRSQIPMKVGYERPRREYGSDIK